MAKLNFDDSDGVWRTIGGHRVFIRTGQSLSSAMKESGKFKSAKKKEYNVKEGNPIKDLADERIKEKENTLINDKAMLSEMQKRGIDEIQGWKKEDFENRIKKNEEYLKNAKGSNDKEEEKKKIGGWRINEQGKKEYYERELADNERGYWTKENGQRVFKENPNYKENKEGLNLSQNQKEAGERLNRKAENGAREDVKTFLSGKEDYDGSQEDFIRDLSNEWGISKEKAEEILHDENIKHPRNFTNNQQKSIETNSKAEYDKKLKEWINSPFGDEEEKLKRERAKNEAYYKLHGRPARNMQESLEKNMPEGAKFSKMLEKNNVKTFADEIKEQNKKTGEKFSVDYFKQRGVEIKDKVPEGYVKLEGATTAPKGYEWYSNGKSRFGGEYKNALVKKEEKGTQLNDKFYTKKDGTKIYDPYKGTPYERKYDSLKDVIDDKDSKLNQYINEKIRRKAYQKYLKEHPASKITFENFKDMNKMK